MAGKRSARMTAAERARVFAALGDPLRVRLMEGLNGGEERTGSELAQELGISLALLCHHSKILDEAGLVEKRKAAQTSYYKGRPEVLARLLEQMGGR